jgi:hypothetical protein
MNAHRASLLLSILLLIAPLAAGAQSSPLLKVHEERADAGGPALLGTVDVDWLVSRGGPFALLGAVRDFQGGDGSPRAYSVATRASAEAMADFGAALAAVRIRNRNDHCRIEVPLGASVAYEINWFGEQNRTARIVVDPEATTSCPTFVQTFIFQLREIRARMLRDAGVVVPRL